MDQTVTAILLGIVEGLTEFIPVSSTGHLILATELFGYNADEWAMFNVMIQLGAILAVVVQYWSTFWNAGMGVLRLERDGLMFLRNILVAFMPSAILALIFKDEIEMMLGSPMLVGVTLVLGGLVILAMERMNHSKHYRPVSQLPLKTAIGVGLAQCLAMVPGVSRSGATIMGALAMGVERRTAAEFSFFLAVPTMLGATAFQLMFKGEELVSGATSVGWQEIAIGFVVSFVVALVVIRAFVAYVAKSGFSPFAWYRIVIGLAAIAWLALR